MPAAEAVAQIKAVIDLARRHMSDDAFALFIRDYAENSTTADSEPD